MIKNYVEIPSTIDEDINKDVTTWKDGLMISLDEGDYITVYIGHEKEDDKTSAFPIRVRKPLERDKLINAAEMQAYGLNTSMDVASFNASLARKFRENEDDAEIKEHDEFISWVKSGLDKIGI